jgi:TolB-like protein/Tfp pilus assembly protein PilF/predicted Ser/Thr protein kinase
MTRVLRICKKCGLAILIDEPEGLCAACLLETSLGMLHDENNGDRTAELPEELGDYQLLEEIGRGGQGMVYRARQKSLNRIVAVKVIGLGRWATDAHIKRFRLEAEAAASLDHPYIVPIHEIGESDGSCYFSMQLVKGQRLDEVIKREPVSNRHTAELIIKLARTIFYAHKRGILHRDIKPGNILIDTDGEPHLTDFGLARLVERESTVTGTMVEALGTPSYMAPEQATGDVVQLTDATDVYGLGAVFYHLLTGKPPFVGGTIYETVRLLLETEPRQPRLLNSKVDRDLSTICLKCLEKDQRRRYSSALALAEDLERWLRHEPIQAQRSGVLTRGKKWVRRKPAIAALIASLIALAAAVGWNVWKGDLVRRPTTTGIAVLPFENLSNDREDASFADGVQDDLLTKLANIADLKVISRASVMQYRPPKAIGVGRNTREIGNALRVSHVLEGSVRKTGAWLHMNAQLIDTRTDSHVWAKQYDGDLKDLFTIQSEIAETVAEQLHAKISPAEKLAIERPPTVDLTAFDLYNRAKTLLLGASFSSKSRENLLQATDLLNQAVAHDPTFFQAYCQLALTHDLLYFLGDDHTPARLALAEAAVQAAFRLRTDAGEAHVARAGNLYMGYLDYDAALTELDAAHKTLPNDPEVFELRGYIERRQGKQEEALRSLELAVELDPRNVLTLQQLALSYEWLRRYAEAESVWNRVLLIKPNDLETELERVRVELNWKADTRPLHQMVDLIRVTNYAAITSIADYWVLCALAEHDAAAAPNALMALGDTPFRDGTLQFSRPFVEGIIARMAKDEGEARAAFTTARAEQEKIVRTQPDYGPPLCVLGLIDAALGRKEDALQEGRHAVELLPVNKDALNGRRIVAYFAMIAAWVGDKNLACEQLEIAIQHSNSPSYGELKLLPLWDPLRGDPRFEEIVASLAPKGN